MIIHWQQYLCPAASRAAFRPDFGRSQELARARGFLGRLGGWDGDGRLWCFELWRDELDATSWRRRIAADAGFLPTPPLAEAQVEVLVAMPGLASTTSRALEEGRILRLVQARVPPERHARLMDEQLRIWRPAMARARGMLGGYFGSSRQDPELFVGASLWQDADGHACWAREVAPRIRAELDADEVVTDLSTHEIRLDPAWLLHRERPASRPSR